MRTDKAKQAIQAAIELFGTQGIDNTSTQSISKKAGIGNATLFKYFETKEELIRNCYLDAKLELGAAFKKDLVPTHNFEPILRKVWVNFLSWAHANPTKYKFLMQIKHSRYLDAEVEKKVEGEFLFFKVALQAAIASGEVVKEEMELLGAIILSFISLAVEMQSLDSSHDEKRIYQLLLNSLKLKANT